MEQVARHHAPSGLAAMPALRWGSHVGHMAGSDADQFGLLVPYFKAGLENHERCLWVTASVAETEDARVALRGAVPDLDTRERSGQIEIGDGASFYDRDRALRAEDIVAGLLEREEQALAAGFAGLRTNGNCAWVGHEDWPEFHRYETLIHATLPHRRMICMCSYRADALDGPQLSDVIGAHDFVLNGAQPPPEAKMPASEGDRPPPAFPPSAPGDEPSFQADIDAIAAMGAVPVLLSIVCRVTGLGFATVARVTGERWVSLAVHDEIAFGMRPGDELDIETTFCRDIWRSRRGIIINDVAAHPVYRDHPTPAMYGFQSYISIPILLSDGRFFGTLCAIDRAPNHLDTPDVIGMFQAFAELIACHLEARDHLEPGDARRLDGRAIAELHDQLITVLGHDLRNPMSAILAGAKFLEAMPLDARARSVIEIIDRSAGRIFGMVEDVADFARARLGGGLGARRSREQLDAALRQAVDELRVVYPEREIRADLAIPRDILADGDQIARLASNLLVNALKYGDPSAPVRIAASGGADFHLSVSNAGAPIPADRIDGLFAPFVRGDVRADQPGLGLGLYIVAEIARAHEGHVEVSSDATETRFTFVMPLTGTTADPQPPPG